MHHCRKHTIIPLGENPRFMFRSSRNSGVPAARIRLVVSDLKMAVAVGEVPRFDRHQHAAGLPWLPLTPFQRKIGKLNPHAALIPSFPPINRRLHAACVVQETILTPHFTQIIIYL